MPHRREKQVWHCVTCCRAIALDLVDALSWTYHESWQRGRGAKLLCSRTPSPLQRPGLALPARLPLARCSSALHPGPASDRTIPTNLPGCDGLHGLIAEISLFCGHLSTFPIRRDRCMQTNGGRLMQAEPLNSRLNKRG